MKKTLFTLTLILLATLTANAAVEKTSSGLKANKDTITTEVRFYSNDIVRVLKYVSSDAKALNDPKLTVRMTPQTVNFTYNDATDYVTLTTSSVQVKYNKTTGAVTFYDASGKEMITEKANATYFTPRKDGTLNSYWLQQMFTLDNDEAIYGLGQIQNGNLNQRNTAYWYMTEGNTCVWIPYLHSVKGYGLYWDNMSPTDFADNTDGMWFKSSSGHAIDYYYMAGSSTDGDIAIKRMRELTGDVPMVPLWAYGYFQSKERYQSSTEVMGVVKKYRNLGVPLDCIVQDWQYWGGNDMWNAMDFLADGYKNDYQEMIDSVHDMHAKIIISFWANFGRNTDQFAYFKAHNELIKCGDTIMTCTYPEKEGVAIYDTYNQDARDYFWSKVYKGLASRGIDAYWMDSSEPDHYQGGDNAKVPAYRCDSAKEKTFDFITGAGFPWRDVRNAFPAIHVGGVYDHHRAQTGLEGKRCTILTRSAYAGQQRTGASTWSGDITASWETLANQIPAALSFSMCGIPSWNCDIGGFFNGKYSGPGQKSYDELYARWIQFGTFTGMMRSHGAGTDRAIYKYGNRGSVYFDNIEKYINLRYALLPYIYSTAWNNHKNGSTFMRAMSVAYPTDTKTADMKDQYMFGNSLLVAPILSAGATNRSVYLPEGKWIDFWNGTTSDGGQTISKSVDIQTIPLYVKAGSIIPWGPKVQYSTEKAWDSLEVRVYPGANGSFTLYEDEFDNYNYENGKYTEIPFTWNDDTQELTIGARSGSYTGMIGKRKFSIVLVDTAMGIGSAQSKKISKIVSYDGTAQTIKIDNKTPFTVGGTTSAIDTTDYRAAKDMFPLNDASKVAFEYADSKVSYNADTHKVTFSNKYQQWGWNFGTWGKETTPQTVDIDDLGYLTVKLTNIVDTAGLEFRMEYTDTAGVKHTTENNPSTNILKCYIHDNGDDAAFFKTDEGYTVKVNLANLNVKSIDRVYFWNSWVSANTEFIVKDAYLYSTVSYNKKTEPGEYTTVCLPRNMVCATNGTKFYTIEGVDNTDNPSKIYLKEYADSMLEAGVPYIMVSASDKVYFNLNSTYVSTPASAIGLKGFYTSTTVPAKAYFFDNGVLRLSDGYNTINAYEAYVDLSKLLTVSSGDATIILNKTTGISNVKSASATDKSASYNVAGQRVNNTYKGIVIKKGKKMIQS
jgi:alpha-D-xyloside xylohydrolase